jgi:hypothetical protein
MTDLETKLDKDHDVIYLGPVCAGIDRTWSQDGAADECECVPKHPVVIYRRVGFVENDVPEESDDD